MQASKRRLPMTSRVDENFTRHFLVRDMNVVLDLRHTADYRDNDVSARQASRALEKATNFVSQIRKGLSDG